VWREGLEAWRGMDMLMMRVMRRLWGECGLRLCLEDWMEDGCWNSLIKIKDLVPDKEKY
jgi:hypothetical protein